MKPVAAFAGILDGQRLWLAIEDAPGSLALRDTASGDVIAPENEIRGDDQPGYKAARMDLADLPGDAGSTYDVVLVPARGRKPQPVLSGPVGGQLPRPAENGRTQWQLGRTNDGMLQVHRGTIDEAAELRSVETTAHGVRLTLTDGTVLELTVDGEPVRTDEQGHVMVGERPIRRRANDLADAGRGAPLPTLTDDSEQERLRLRWSPRGLLMARLVEPEGDE